MTQHRLRTTGATAAAIIAVLAIMTPAGLASQATKSADTEGLVSYVTTGKLKVKKKISYSFVCSTACQVTVSSTLVLKGPNLGPVIDTGNFAAGEVGSEFLTFNRGARNAIKDHLGASKLRTSIFAVDTATGATDTDPLTFRFKR